MCRICHEGDEEEELVSPCDCPGTMGMLHISCLCNFPAFSASTRVTFVASVTREMRRRSLFHHVIALEPWACFICRVSVIFQHFQLQRG